MLKRLLKKSIATFLIVTLIFTSQAFFVFAEGVNANLDAEETKVSETYEETSESAEIEETGEKTEETEEKIETEESEIVIPEDNSRGELASPDSKEITPEVEDEEEITKAILIPVAEASANLEKMRAVEGQRLADDLISKGETIKGILDKIEVRSPLVVKDYMEKLRARITELLDGAVEIPEERILTEAAIFADKCAIDEEITRLNSHLVQLKTILTGSESTVGKKLDFLVQEMNREANTIGSKANDLEITNKMLNIKAEIEKIREQVQNIE